MVASPSRFGPSLAWAAAICHGEAVAAQGPAAGAQHFVPLWCLPAGGVNDRNDDMICKMPRKLISVSWCFVAPAYAPSAMLVSLALEATCNFAAVFIGIALKALRLCRVFSSSTVSPASRSPA